MRRKLLFPPNCINFVVIRGKETRKVIQHEPSLIVQYSEPRVIAGINTNLS